MRQKYEDYVQVGLTGRAEGTKAVYQHTQTKKLAVEEDWMYLRELNDGELITRFSAKVG